MNATAIREAMRDETDPPGLPPFITRSTAQPVRVCNSPADTMLHQIMLKFEQSFEHNFKK
jgi:hypothetical protein